MPGSTILGQTSGGEAQAPGSGVPRQSRHANTPISSEAFLEPVVAVEKWRGARLSNMTFDEWRKYHYGPALIDKKQQYADARPARQWTAYAEYKFLDNCVDHTVQGIAEARRLLIDQGVFEAEEVDYREVLDIYIGHLEDVGKSAAQEFQRQVISERAGGFNKSPTELAREVRRAHVARYGQANFRTANELLYDLLVAPWSTVPDLKQRESNLRWDLQPLRFSELDKLSDIATRVADMEDKALREETNALIMRRDSQLHQQILGAHKETRVINGQPRPRCDVCTALNEDDQFHSARYCPTRKALRQGKSRAKEAERVAWDGKTPRQSTSQRFISVADLEARLKAELEAELMATSGRPDRRNGGGKRPDPGQEECWNCKGKGHRFTSCPHKITDESCLRRLRIIPREYAERQAYIERHPLASSTSNPRQADVQPLVSILKPPQESQQSNNSVRFAADAKKGDSDDDYWLSTNQLVSYAHSFPTPAAATPAPPAPPRPRGRPRVLPQGTAQDPALRMHQPGWDAQRERLNHLPQGFAPAGAAPQPSAPQPRDAQSRDIRTQQLLHNLRAAFQHARFPSLATTTLTEGGERQRQRWIDARAEILQGQLNVRDHCAVAWQAAVDDVVRRFLAQARLTWADLSRIDLRVLCAQAIRSVYGIDLPGVPVITTPVTQPPVETTQPVRVGEGPQPTPPVAPVRAGEGSPPTPTEQPQPPATVTDVDDVVDDYMERLREWNRQHDQPTPETEEATSVALTVLDLADRQPLSEHDPVLERRQQMIADLRPYPTVRRRWMAMVDTEATRVTVGGVECQLVLVDSGCDWLSIHTSVAVQAGYTYAAGEHVNIQGSTGVGKAYRTEQPVTIMWNPNTNWATDWTVPSAVVHADERLPEVIVDTGTLAAMMAVMHFGKWQFTYPVEPEHMASGGGAHAVVPLTPVPPEVLRKEMRQLQKAVELGGGHTRSTKPSASSAALNSFKDSHFDYDDQSAPPSIAMAAVQRVPSFQEQRDTIAAKGRHLPFGPHDEGSIRAVGSLRAAKDPSESIYRTNLGKASGEAGSGLRNLYAASGMLTTLMQQVLDGLHFYEVFILEKDPILRQIIHRQLEKLHEWRPRQLPRSSFTRALDWAEDIYHDISKLNGKYLIDRLGELDEVHAEPPCQGVSAYGLQLGLFDHRTGVMVDLAAALVDYHHILAQRRGIKDWAVAPAQFGFVIENVTPAPKARRSREVDEFCDFMERVFGRPVMHRPDLCGSLTTRTACWWTNMFPPEYYERVEREFHREPDQSLADVVREVTNGRLEPQTVTHEMGRTHPLNVVGELQRMQPKYVSRVDNVMQIVQPDGRPGPGMLRVVGSDPPRYERTPAAVRERALMAPAGWYTRPELGLTEAQQIQAIGNICSPISVSVMTRIRVAFSQQAAQLQWIKIQRIAPDWDDEREGQRIVAELQREVLQAIDLEREYAKADAIQADHDHPKVSAKVLARNRERGRGVEPAPTTPRQPTANPTKAKQRRQQERRQWAYDTGQRLQKQRENVARTVRLARWSAGDPAVVKPTPTRGKQAGTVFTLLTWLSLLSTTCAQCYTAGAACGADAMRAAMKTSRPAPTANATVSEALLTQCYTAFGNKKATGQPEAAKLVPSRLKSTKDGSDHQWQIGESFKAAGRLAAVMDEGLFAWGLHNLAPVDHEPYEFELEDDTPVFRRQYHLAKRESEWAERWVKDLERCGLVEEISSPWAAPVVVAPKKDETGAWTDFRYAIDYRGVNTKTKRDRYPCPTAEDIMSRMEGASIFSCCDAQKAFHSLRVAEKCKPYLSFHAGSRLMTWNRMPFGHKNSVAAWQRVVDDALRGIEFAAAFADDIIIWSADDEEEHIRRVKVVLDRLRQKGVQLSPKKCKLGMRRIEFLGHIISREGVEPQWDKVEAIDALPAPKTVSEVRSFLGMATYYCKFLPEYSHIKKPLTELTRQTVKWQWTHVEETAFQRIKELLKSAKVLRSPDWTRPFHLHTDWSKAGVGAVLSQTADDGVEYVIAYASRMNTTAESNFSAYEGEVSAVVWAVQKFRYWLWGAEFKLITDCKAMEWLRSTARLRSKLARWSLILAEYDFTVKHRPGKENTVPDLFSRQPAASEGISEANYFSSHPVLPPAWRRLVAKNASTLMTMGAAEAVIEWPNRDIWESPTAIRFVKGELSQAEVTPQQWAALQRKCAPYHFAEGRLWKRMAARRGGQWLEVPPLAQRMDIIHAQHGRIGHLGRDRTCNMVARYYIWPRMYADVCAALKQCRVCDRARATFSVKHDRLQPMPIFGQFYRFSVDSAGPLRPTKKGHEYVVIIVEHFSKWIELVPLVSLDAASTAAAFHERVLARYGAPVEVVTDNGAEYHGEFSVLLKQHGIDQVEIPAGHPSSNGMAERIVNVLKLALRKFVSEQGTLKWETWLPIIEFGYRVTVQASTGFSPYFLMYGREPVSPMQCRAMLQESVDVDDPAAMLDLISVRADILRSAMPRAFEHSLRAQVRDIVRYRKVRQGDVQPRSHRFTEGSYVYYMQRPLNTLDMRVSRTILRVRKVHNTGWLELEGSDGRVVEVHADQCAPCHLSNLVPAGQQAPGLRCEHCGSDSRSDALLVCDKCSRAWHSGCMQGAVPDPEADWLCPRCSPPSS